MTPDQHRQISQIFDAALKVPPADRAAFLDQACVDDTLLRCEVQSLLAAHEESASLMDAPAMEAVADVMMKTNKTSAGLTAGVALGSYEILGLIGAGGMGEVYAARDPQLHRKVALKVLRAPLAMGVDRLRRFQQEARAVSALNHPNIVTIHEIGQARGVEFIAYEFVEGETLRQRMQQPLKLTGALDMASQIADALVAAHSAGVIHRDLKPENIMVRPDGYVKVLDFGLAKLSEMTTTTMAVTEPGLVMGTCSYMSPEQARGLEVDSRTDIFSFGVVLYEMVTGRRPFEGPTMSDVIAAILKNEPRPLLEYAENTPPELQRIVTKALAKNRDERFQTVNELSADLKKLKHRVEAATPLARTVAVDNAQRPMSKPQRPRLLLLLASIIALSGLVTGLYRWKPIATSPAAARDIHSIAVLPLRNLSRDSDQEYLAAGMTEALTNGLGQIGALNVISRTSVMRYQDTDKSAPEIARELNVDALVEGSVQRSNGTVLINVELVDAASDHQLWARSYQRATTDFLSLQNEVAQAIASEIKVKITSQEQARLNGPPPVRPEAQEAYLRGVYWQDKADPKKFYEYMQQAIQKDPTYALAYAALSDAYGVMIYSGMIPEKEAYPKWREAVSTALQLDDNLAEAHRAFAALLLYHDYKWQDAEREFRRALELNPNLVDAHLWLADGLVAVGRVDEAVVEARRAVQLNPYSVLANSRLAQDLFFARRFDEAVSVSRGMLELAPGYAHWVMGLVDEQNRKLDSAIAEYQEAIKLAGGNPDLRTWVPASLGHAYAITGKKADALRIVSELTELSSLIRVDPAVFAIIYAGLGDKDRAFEWLVKGYDDRPSTAMRIKVEPRLEPLRSDPRFVDFIRKMGLES